jgi:hypothetical protein
MYYKNNSAVANEANEGNSGHFCGGFEVGPISSLAHFTGELEKSPGRIPASKCEDASEEEALIERSSYGEASPSPDQCQALNPEPESQARAAKGR